MLREVVVIFCLYFLHMTNDSLNCAFVLSIAVCLCPHFVSLGNFYTKFEKKNRAVSCVIFIVCLLTLIKRTNRYFAVHFLKLGKFVIFLV